MWRPLLKTLSAVGRLRFPVLRRAPEVGVGDPRATDSLGGHAWKRFANTEALWQVWGPHADSPWAPYHCVTLFAALDLIVRRSPDRVGPLPVSDAPAWLVYSGETPEWATQPGTMAVLDLSGTQTVAVAYALLSRRAFQPVCTFDSWPNEHGVLKPERLLGAMLFYAAALSERRKRLAADAPPLWICDRDRISGPRPSPGQYDNRYIIEDRLLPGFAMLLASGIHTVVYVGDNPTSAPSPDLVPYLVEMRYRGLRVQGCSIASEDEFQAAEPLALPDKTRRGARLTSQRLAGLMRSSAGGFGGYVPHPSSGG